MDKQFNKNSTLVQRAKFIDTVGYAKTNYATTKSFYQ